MPSPDQLGHDIVGAVGIGAARELLDAITRPEEERASLIGRLAVRDDASWLVELLTDLEVIELARLQVSVAMTATLDPK
jgi:hypothetical protein